HWPEPTMRDALSVVCQLRDLASEPQNREAIVQDQGCLPGLVLFLDHQDAETLRYLAELTPNIPTMKNELDIFSKTCKTLAKEVYIILSQPANPAPRTPERQRRKKPQFFINSSSKKAKSVTLHIQGLDSTVRLEAFRDSFTFRGISDLMLLHLFLFSSTSEACVKRLCSRLNSLKNLATAIAATKVLSAQQVVKNETGEEVYIPLNPAGTEVPQNSALPDYLPEEEESPEREVDRAISRTAAKEDSSGSWLNAAASFLSKSFYW
uniref:Armadillo repeat containing 1, like n=1 Tax=Oryzias sinensis TaxID=183150 RepID=A0A8C7ZAA4_9TELE